MARETISAKEALERLHKTGDIRDCVIIGNLDVSNQVFKNTVNAVGTVFADQVSWSGATFEGSVFYSDTVFKGKTFWTQAHFKKDVRWVRTIFEGDTFWNGITFDRNAYWGRVIIKGRINVSSKEIFEILQGVKAEIYISLEDYRKG